MHRILTLAFLFPLEEGENESNALHTLYFACRDFNKFVAKICTHSTCHVELVFENDMAFSIFKGSNLFFKSRTFSNQHYRLVSICVTPEEYAKAYDYCFRCAQMDISFNDVGLYLTLCPCCATSQPSIESGYAFCSQIVTEALLAAGVAEVEGLIPCKTTPSMLYEVMEQQNTGRNVINSIGCKRDLLKYRAVMH